MKYSEAPRNDSTSLVCQPAARAGSEHAVVFALKEVRATGRPPLFRNTAFQEIVRIYPRTEAALRTQAQRFYYHCRRLPNPKGNKALCLNIQYIACHGLLWRRKAGLKLEPVIMSMLAGVLRCHSCWGRGARSFEASTNSHGRSCWARKQSCFSAYLYIYELMRGHVLVAVPSVPGRTRLYLNTICSSDHECTRTIIPKQRKSSCRPLLCLEPCRPSSARQSRLQRAKPEEQNRNQQSESSQALAGPYMQPKQLWRLRYRSGCPAGRLSGLGSQSF